MIYSIRGKLLCTGDGFAVIEAGGVGFKCNTTQNTLSRLSGRSEAMLYTCLIVRENAIELCSFATEQELSCYQLLTQVNGVGPKAALSILSVMTPEQFALAVACGDSKMITKAQGIGNKIAQRICLELKDKIGSFGSDGGAFTPSSPNASSNAAEAVDALVVLGFSKSEASGVVSKLDGSMSVEEMIRAALLRFNKLQ